MHREARFGLDKQLIKGSATLLVLEVLGQRAMHGYELLRELEAKSDGALGFKEGTIYPLLRSLEREGALRAEWSVVGGRRRRVYALTEVGAGLLAKKRRDWSAFREAIERVIGRPETQS